MEPVGPSLDVLSLSLRHGCLAKPQRQTDLLGDVAHFHERLLGRVALSAYTTIAASTAAALAVIHACIVVISSSESLRL